MKWCQAQFSLAENCAWHHFYCGCNCRRAKARVHARGEVPAEKLAGVAGKMSDSPLKATLERIAREGQSRRTRSKT